MNEVAASTTYNAKFVGTADYHTVPSVVPSQQSYATLSLSQLSSTVTGTIVVTGFSPVMQDTLLTASVMGRTTSDGLDVTIVRVAGCSLHLTGPLALQSDGSLSGTLAGSDCNASGQNDIALALHVSRQ